MLLPHTRAEDAEQLADSVVSALARPYAAAPEIPVTASVGLTVGRATTTIPACCCAAATWRCTPRRATGGAGGAVTQSTCTPDLLTRVELQNQLREGLQ
jgi:hypothetical protein